MKFTRQQLKEKCKELIFTFGEECMIEQIEENYEPQSIREKLPGYKEEDDKLYLYNTQYLIKGYNIRYLKNLSKEEQLRVVQDMNQYKERILWKKCEARNKKDNNMER